MPIKNMIGIIVAVAMGIFKAYSEVTARLTSLETSRELFENDLLKKKSTSTYRPSTISCFWNSLFGDVEKLQITQEQNM